MWTVEELLQGIVERAPVDMGVEGVLSPCGQFIFVRPSVEQSIGA